MVLGTFEDQSYEAFYTRTEWKGIIYTLAIKGKADRDDAELVLLAFDPEEKWMKTFTVSSSGFPFTDMAVVKGKLYIMNHEMAGRKKDKIYEFDPVKEEVKEILSFDSESDSLRAICAADEGFYLLRLMIKDRENEMFVDLYDGKGVKKAEQSVNEAMVNAIMTIPGMMNRQDALNEIGMHAVHFSVSEDRYMFYENASVARLILDLHTGKALFAKEDLYSISTGNGDPVIYYMDYDSETIKDPEILGLEKGRMVSYAFQPTESHGMLRNVSRSEGGTWLVTMSDNPRSINWTLVVHLWTDDRGVSETLR